MPSDLWSQGAAFTGGDSGSSDAKAQGPKGGGNAVKVRPGSGGVPRGAFSLPARLSRPRLAPPPRRSGTSCVRSTAKPWRPWRSSSLGSASARWPRSTARTKPGKGYGEPGEGGGGGRRRTAGTGSALLADGCVPREDAAGVQEAGSAAAGTVRRKRWWGQS